MEVNYGGKQGETYKNGETGETETNRKNREKKENIGKQGEA